MSYKVVLISSETCGACKTFNNSGIWENLKKQYVGKDVSFEEVKLSTFDASEIEKDRNKFKKFPKSIKSVITWFPTILFIEGKTWGTALDDKTNLTHENVKIMNGEYSPSQSKVVQKYDYNRDVAGISKWIEDNKSGITTTASTKGIEPLIPKNPKYKGFQNPNCQQKFNLVAKDGARVRRIPFS